MPPASVSTRTFEIGVRTALGADRSRVMRSLLHGVSPADPIALGGLVAVLRAVGALGSVLPALRASRIEPTEALRSQ